MLGISGVRGRLGDFKNGTFRYWNGITKRNFSVRGQHMVVSNFVLLLLIEI